MSQSDPIVIAIEGDAASADEALGSTDETLAALQETFASIQAAAEAMAESLQAAFEAVSAGADAMAGSLDGLSGSLDAASGSADAAAGSLGGVGTAGGEAAAGVSAAGDAAAAADEKFLTLDFNVNAAGDSFKKLKMPLLVAGAAVVGLGVLAVHMAGDFQDSMTQLVTGAGESKNNLATVSAGVLAISAQVGTSAKDTAAGMYLIESAGYHGKAGLAVLQAAEEGAKVGGAQMATVADATTTILNDFGGKNVSAANAVNALIATVAQGKTHLQDLGQSLAQILPTASAAGVGLNDVMGAMATMTSEGVPAANAATYLRQTIIALDAPSAASKKALASIGLTSADVSTEMQKSLPGALEMITDRLAKKFPVGSAAYVAALKDIAGGSKQMQGMLDLTGQHLGTFQTDVQNVAGAVKKGGSTILGWNDVQKDFNTKLAQTGVAAQNMLIALGQAIMPVAQAVMSKLMPAISGITSWIEGHGKQAAQIFGILAAAIGGALVVALGAAAVAFLIANAAALPFIAIGMALGVGIALLVTHWKQVTQAMQPVINLFKLVWGFIKPLADELKSSLGQTLKQLGETFRTQLLPAWHQLQAAFVQIMPYLKILGAIIGGYIVIQLAIFIGLLKGVLGAIGPLASGLIRMLGGAFQVVAGIVRIFSAIVGGTVQLVIDLIHGKWGKLGGDLLAIWNGVKAGVGQIFAGLWNIIAGFFGGLLGAVGGFLSGFVSGVIGFFQHLFEKLVGHSIIPDMIKGIVAFFASLPGKVLGLVAGLVSGVIGHMAQMATGVVSHVARMVPGVGGILDALHHTTSDKTAIMRDEAAIHADEMKARSLTAFAAMQMGAAHHFDAMRQKLVAEIKNTSDPVKRHALEMQLAVVTNAEKMHLGAAKSAEAMATKVTAHAQEMAADAKAKAADMHDGVIGRFTDMAQNVVSTASQLPGKILTAVTSLDTKLATFFGSLAGKALSWGANIISGLISGIGSQLGNLTSKLGDVAGKIKGFLGFGSPTEEGPGSTADTWMPNLIGMLARDLTAGAGTLRAAANAAAAGLAAGFAGAGAGGIGTPRLPTPAAALVSPIATAAVAPSSVASPAGAGAGVNGGMTRGDALMLGAKLDVLHGDLLALGHGGGSSSSPAGTASGAAAGITLNGAQFNGVTDLAALYRALNALGGIAAENSLRGANAGLAI